MPKLEPSDKYLEAHITVEPLSVHGFDLFRQVLADRNWKASKFDQDDVDEMHGKWFASARFELEGFARGSVIGVASYLKRQGYKILRAKIERTLWDTNLGDTYEELMP